MSPTNAYVGTSVETTHKHLICWKSVIGGLFVTFFTLIGLVGLGMAFGGIGLDKDTTMSGASMFTGIWFLASCFISVLAGSYFTARVSRSVSDKMGTAQGLVVASIFAGVLLCQSLLAVGMIGKAAGTIAAGANRPMTNPTMDRMIEDSMGDLQLKSEPRVVATGIASRLMNGNIEGAKSYLARESNLTPQEIDTKIAMMKAQIEKAIDDAKEVAAKALRSTGWSLTILVALCAIAAMVGGTIGSRINFTKPWLTNHNIHTHQTV